MELILLLFLGIISGIIAGLFGLGGGILFTPILFVMFNNAGLEDPVLLTVGSSLFCTFIASAGSSLRQYHQVNFYFSEGLKVGLLGVLGVSLGKLIVTSDFYSEEEFVIFFSLLLMYVAAMFFRRGSKKPAEITIDRRPLSWNQTFVTGGLGGFVAVLAGIGGGGVMVPLMNLLFKKEFSKTVSISSLAIVLISFSGWFQLALTGTGTETLTRFQWGYVDFGAAFPLATGGLIGGFLGAYFNLKISRRFFQFTFSILALGMALKLLSEVYL